jgi:hypothetical protein
MKKNQGFAGLFIKESTQRRYLSEAYFNSGLLNLLKDGAKAGWVKGSGSFAKSLGLKSTAGVDHSFVKGTLVVIGGGPERNLNRLANVIDDLRKCYGAMHNRSYNSLADMNYEDTVMFDPEEVAKAVGNKKNFTSPYKGVRIYSKVSPAGDIAYEVEYGVEMIK